MGFFELLTLGININYRLPTSAQSLAASSDVVVVADFLEIVEGRTFNGARCEFGTRHMSLARMRVLEVAQGSAGEELFVELGPHSRVVLSSDLDQRKIRSPVLVFLANSTRYPSAAALPAGLPAGEILWELNTPQALLIESGDRVTLPLEPDQDKWMEVPGRTLREVIQSLMRR